MNPDYGVTPFGFRAMRLINIKNMLEDLFIAEFGDINLDAQSVTGQLIGIYSKVLADIWENMEDVYQSQYPNSASGVSLDNVVQLNGITRLPAQQTFVIGAATGLENTLIPANSLARIPQTDQVFFSTTPTFITRDNSIRNIFQILSLGAQAYTVIINGLSYYYSLPVIGLSGPLVSGNTISGRINGVNIPTITFITDSATTLGLFASAILATLPLSIASATVVGNTIELVPVLGSQILVNSITPNGVGAPTYIPSFIAPSALDEVAEYLAAVIDNSNNVSGTWVSGNTFTIQALDSAVPYSLNYGTRLSVTETTSPVPFLAQSYGPIPVPANTLTEILTPVAGWTSLTNFQAGVTGRNVETDEELRLRRARSLRVTGTATVEAIIARLLQEVVGVTSVLVFENVTITQDPILVTFSSDFIAGNSVQVNLDGLNIGTVTFITDHLAMITAIANLIAAQPPILSVLVGGTGNRSLGITMNESQEVEIDFAITGSGAPTYVEAGGRPPKSFEAVVEGGSDQAVALKIWQVKPAGIQTYGNVNDGNGIVIVDSQGNNQTIFFSRAIPVYIWVTVTLTLNPQETFPTNGQQLVAESILAYGDSLGIGIDVFIQRVQAAVFAVPGIASATVQLARTLNPTDTPTYASIDVLIAETEISTWDLSRIFVSI